MTAAPAPPRSWQSYVPWLFGLVAFAIAAKKLIGGYDDLGIYLDVAREFQQGGFDLCRERENSGPWIYPPCAALPFVLLDATLGNAGARWAWCALLGLATALLLRALAQTIRHGLPATRGLHPWQWLAFGLLFQRCIAQNLSHGQLSLCIGTLVAMGTASLVRGRDISAGVLFGLAAAGKLTPVLFLVALPLMGRTKSALAMAATIAIAVLLLPWPLCGTEEHFRHLADFYRTISQALLHPDAAAITAGHAGPNIRGTLDYLLQPLEANNEGYTVNIANVSDATLQTVRLAWSALLGSLLLAWFWLARRHDAGRRLLEQCSAVLMALAFFAPLVRVYHLAAMLVPAVLFCRGPRQAANGRRDWLWFGTALILLATMTLRQRKLIGESLWRWLDLGGALHFGLVGMLIWLIRSCRVPPTSTQ